MVPFKYEIKLQTSNSAPKLMGFSQMTLNSFLSHEIQLVLQTRQLQDYFQQNAVLSTFTAVKN